MPYLRSVKLESKQFQHNYATISYVVAGNGKEPLLLFHGFGQDHTSFSPYLDPLSNHFTLYVFDLFFHGKSEWQLKEAPLSKKQWISILTHFLEENAIENFSLLGFSLGGKFVLASLEAFSNRVNAIILLAPDGIKTNFWYSMATYPIALRGLFKSMITKPGRFLGLVKLASRLRLVDKSVSKFAQSQMATEEMRKRVYYSWVVFRHLNYDLNKIAKLINQNEVKLDVFIGQFDKIITTKNMRGLLSKVPGANLHLLKAGHNTLIAESMKVLTKYEAGKGINSP